MVREKVNRSTGQLQWKCKEHGHNVKFESEKIPHEYSTVGGIQESLHEILMNLKEIVLRSNIYGTCHASICVKGPGYNRSRHHPTACVEIVDNTQHIANLTEPIDLCI
ncbi:hypothetical protein Leryth_027235 [Lithospermum erythrorhizon]|nr:hypothetical protein Leryth_027235 [Lithospermum erythrorhizon]